MIALLVVYTVGIVGGTVSFALLAAACGDAIRRHVARR